MVFLVRLLLILFFLGCPTGLLADLSCDFWLECCWSSADEWAIREHIGINDYMSTFMVGRGRPPPRSHYVIRSVSRGYSSYHSCPVCSSSGSVHIQYRHWQSPSAVLQLCWHLANQTVNKKDCLMIAPSRQSQLVSQQVTIPKDTPVQLAFVLMNSEPSVKGVVMFDRIHVKADTCTAKKTPKTSTTEPDVRTLQNMTMPPTIVPFPANTTIPSTISPSSSNTTIPPTIPPSPANPLNDLLGEDFVKFLDPNYQSEDNTEDNVDTEEATTPKKVSRLEMDECSTEGGCLFEHSLCGYEQPKGIKEQAPFRRIVVGTSNFIQTEIPPNDVSVIAHPTNMTEAHVVLYDSLSWQSGSRLAGCCSQPKKPLSCTYSPSTIIPIWQPVRLDCPTGTNQILFICENYGKANAVCALDNIRLHVSSDIFFLEPCQKHALDSL